MGQVYFSLLEKILRGRITFMFFTAHVVLAVD